MAYIDINDNGGTGGGSATAANQVTEIALLTSIDSKEPTLGQKTMAGSEPVVIASDQSGVPVKVEDGAGTPITSTASGPKQGLDVNVINSTSSGVADKTAFVYGTTSEQPIGGVYQDTSPGLTAGTTGAIRVTQNRGLHTNLRDNSGTETGTSVNPLRTDPTGTTPQPVSGTVTSNQGAPNIATNGWPVKPTDGTNSQSYTGAGESKVSITQPLPAGVNAIGAVTQSGTWTVQPGNIPNTTPWLFTINQGGNSAFVTGANALKVDGSAVTQPVSGTITANQGGTWNINNISGTISLPTGAATSALQTAGNTSLASIDSKTPALGQALAAASVPVVLTAAQLATLTPLSTVAVTQSTSPWVVSGTGTFQTNVTNVSIPVTQSGAWNINNISGTISLPTGAATSALQTTGNTSLSSIDTKIPSNLTVTSNRLLVDGSGVTQPISGTVTANAGTGTFQTNLAQVGGAAIALGQQLAAGSIPVVTQADALPATQNITAQDVASITTAFANGQNFITGTPTAGSAASFAFSSFDSVEVQVTGIWTGTLQSEFSIDGGTTWFTRGIKQAGVGYVASSFTANFAGGANIAGATNYRVRATAAWTGTATVKIVLSVNPASLTVSNSLLLKDATTQSITNTIKAASTAAVATDTSLVVALNPNTAINLPTGASTAANQTTANTSLASIDSKLTAPLSVTETQAPSPWYHTGDVATAATTQTVIMRTSFTYETANTTPVIQSSSANDTLAGTGAQKITITYFKADGSGPFTTVENMQGTTIFFSAASGAFIESVVVSQVGSGGTNAGTILVSDLSPLSTMASINPGDNETYYCHHFVPLGKTAYITDFSFSSSATAAGQGGKFILKKHAIPFASNAILTTIGTFNLVGSSSADNISFMTPVKVVGPALIFCYIIPDSATANTFTAAVGGYEI